jgi:O-succinylbenzoate synthase
MQLVASRLTRVGGPIARGGARRGSEALRSREGLVLELESERGEIGTGEASPLGGFHPETLDEVAEALAGIHE